MNKKLILILALVGVLVVSGCEEDRGQPVSDIDSNCYKGCYGFHGTEEVTSKVCECVNENNVSYSLDFICGRIENCFLTFEDKKKMAMIDDNWYCVCDEEVEGYYCKEEWNGEGTCITRDISKKQLNITTEFIWKY